MKIILCGYNWIGCEVLDFLLKNNHEVFVYTHTSPSHIPSLEVVCQNRGIEYSLNNISFASLPFTPDIVVSIYYRYLIKEDVIQASKGRIFNLHPSLLPNYRGCSSLTWALINGEPETGFTYHYIDKGCDTGKIILQGTFEIKPWDTQLSIYQRAMFEASYRFEEAFSLVSSGYQGVPQDGASSYNKRGCPYGGIIDSDWDIEFIERFIRAMHFPPYKPASFNGVDILSIDNYLEELKKDT